MSFGTSIVLIYALLLFLTVLTVLCTIVRTLNIKKKIKGLSDSVLEITPEEFFKIRNSSNGGRGRRHISTEYDFPGVYIIYNHTQDMYYVGQGKKRYFSE